MGEWVVSWPVKRDQTVLSLYAPFEYSNFYRAIFFEGVIKRRSVCRMGYFIDY